MQNLEKRMNKALDEYTGEMPHSGVTNVPKKTKTDELNAPKGNELKGAGGNKKHPLLMKMKAYKVPCFKPSDNLVKKNAGNKRALEHNYARQLKHQQNGLNDLSIGEYMENRKRYAEMKRHGTGGAQASFRNEFQADLEESLKKSYGKNHSRIEAKKLSTKRAQDIMDNLAALHDPDMTAGGHDKVSRMGNKGVNSSIGPQWSKKPKTGKSRVQLMDQQVEQAFKKFGPDAKLNIQLERCPLNKK